MRQSAIVYVATNRDTGHMYVGMTTLSVEARAAVHISEARRRLYDHSFHAALRSHPTAFTWVAVSTHDCVTDAAIAEADLISRLQPEYNSGRAGSGRFGPCSFSRAVVVLTDDNRTFQSASEAARHYGIRNTSSVVQVCLRKPYRHRAAGHIFRYLDDNEGLAGAQSAATKRRMRIRADTTNIPRPIECTQDGRTFTNAKLAAAAYGLRAVAISDVCRGRYLQTGGLSFRYCGPPAVPAMGLAQSEIPPSLLGVREEEWRRLAGSEQIWAVSNRGRVCSLDRIAPHRISGVVRKRGLLLKLRPDKDGYLVVALRRNGKNKTERVHALVAEMFVGARPKGLSVLHKNGVRDDNRACNLYYGTAKDNAEDARRHGTLPVGERQWLAKLTAPEVREIISMRGQIRQRDLARLYGVAQATIQRIQAGETWRHLSEGHR